MVRLSRRERDAAPALTLLAGVTVALVWSALDGGGYQHVVNRSWIPLTSLGIGSLHDLIAQGAMAVFFVAVGFELKREYARGALHHWRHAIPASLGAVGGMAAPAALAIGIGLLTRTPALVHGWGIPMSTDVAFTLGVVGLLARGAPPTLRVFLLTLAIADDVLGVVVLTVAGSSHLRPGYLVLAAVVVGASVLLGRRRAPAPLIALAVAALWLTLAAARLEPVLAGVIVGLAIPADTGAQTIETWATRVSTVLALPLFALVSTGVDWSTLSGRGSTTTIVIATMVARIVGKVVGIVGGVALARRLGAPPPSSLPVRLVAAAAVPCAIGFTVPLLFLRADFPPSSSTYAAFTVALVATTLVASVLAAPSLRGALRRH